MKLFLVKDASSRDTVWLVLADDDIKLSDLANGDQYSQPSKGHGVAFHNISVQIGNDADPTSSLEESALIRKLGFVEEFVRKFPRGCGVQIYPVSSDIKDFCEYQCIQKCPENCENCYLKSYGILDSHTLEEEES